MKVAIGRGVALGSLAWVALVATTPAQQPARNAPAPADTSFAATVARLSEQGAHFDTDNLISNEASYLHVMGSLRDMGVRGGAYLGVGPDQNFSYIAQIKPTVAIIVDIRRDNLLHHLLFRAIFEAAPDRLSYLGVLLGRPASPRGERTLSIEEIVSSIDAAPLDRRALDSTHARLNARIRAYGVPLDSRDLETIRRFHTTFAEAGLGLRFQSHGRPPRSYYPTLRDLILERDREGRHASYLSTEAAYQYVRSMQLRGRVIPVVGDLAGDSALPAIARYLRERTDRVSAYYTSNVEFYLAGDGKLDAFVANVRRLPHLENAVLIRSVFRSSLPQTVPGYRSTQLLQPFSSLLREHEAGRIRNYDDLVTADAR